MGITKMNSYGFVIGQWPIVGLLFVINKAFLHP